jgi:membrane protein YdbS with pleckstrin-like domain
VGPLAGAFTYLAVRRIRRTERTDRVATWLVAVSVGEVLLCAWWADALGGGGRAAVAGVAFPVLVGALALSTGRISRVLSTGPMLLGGRISFALYLVHIPVFEVFYTAMEWYPLLRPDGAVASLLTPHVLLLPLPLAWLLYRYVEEPARRGLRDLAGPRRLPATSRPTRRCEPALRSAPRAVLGRRGCRSPRAPGRRTTWWDPWCRWGGHGRASRRGRPDGVRPGHPVRVAYPDKLLAEDEEVVRHLHPHWLTLARPVLVLLLVVGGTSFGAALVPSGPSQGTVRAVMAGLALLVLVVAVLRPVLRWRTTHYVVTTHRVLLREGVLARRGRDIALSRIADVSYRQTLGQRLVSSGTLTIESAGDGGATVLERVPDSDGVQQLLVQLMEEAADRRGTHPSGAVGWDVSGWDDDSWTPPGWTTEQRTTRL